MSSVIISIPATEAELPGELRFGNAERIFSMMFDTVDANIRKSPIVAIVSDQVRKLYKANPFF